MIHCDMTIFKLWAEDCFKLYEEVMLYFILYPVNKGFTVLA